MNDMEFKKYIRKVYDLCQNISEDSIALAVNKITSNKEATLFLVGNGGSAAIASHFATDLLRTFEIIDVKSRVFSLTDNTPLLLASGNDFGFEEIFARQLAQYGREGDILVAISSSGNSENVLKAVQEARRKGLFSIGITGFDGGKLMNLVDISLHVATEHGEYELVEDIHSSICHFISKSIRNSCRDF